MTSQERDDLEKLRDDVSRIRQTAFSDLGYLDTATAQALTQQGYGDKTNAEAMQDRFRYYVKQVQKRQAEHVRKYPDGG